jgi:hypothetical protein
MTLSVNQAALDDTGAICAAFCARIAVWQRFGADGRVETLPYADLCVYDRWLHGGAWLSIETAAVWLNHLLGGAGIARVAHDEDGALVGYAEAYVSSEPDPFGRALHIHHLLAADESVTRALLAQLSQDARTHKCARLTATRIAGESELEAAAALSPIATLRRYTLSARQGQVFYRAVDHRDADAGQIAGWAMPIGRESSARTAWEMHWGRHFETIPQLAAARGQRLSLSVAGQDALVYMQRYLYDPRAAEVAVWSPKPLTPQVVSAVRDWAHREGYRTLRVLVHDDDRPALGADADPDGYSQQACTVTPARGA